MPHNKSVNSRAKVQTKPNVTPLILMIIGTCLLAFPSSMATLALFETSATSSPNVNEQTGQFLLILSLAGFGLLFGYFLTLIFRRYSFLFWLCSGLYNLALSGVVGYFAVSAILSENLFHGYDTGLLWLLLFTGWIIFMTIASGYYAFRSIRPKSSRLP